MKKISLFFVACLIAFVPFAQEKFVSQEVMLKTFLFEEMTGVHCGYCPEGHRIMNELIKDYGERVVPINVHYSGGGPLTMPYPGDPDFRTKDGDSVYGFFKKWAKDSINQNLELPQAMVNRTGGLSNGKKVIFIGRGHWRSIVIRDSAKIQPANIAVKATINKETRELTATVQVYYTDDVISDFNLMDLVLVQDSILANQYNMDLYSQMIVTVNGQKYYQHNHMLRDFITPIWGDTIKTTQAGDFWEKEYKYTLPDTLSTVAVNLDYMRVIAFVSDETIIGDPRGRVLAAAANREYLPILGIESPSGQESNLEVNLYPNPAKEKVTLDFGPSVKMLPVEISIYDMAGNQVLHVPSRVYSSSTDLNIQELPKGIYFVKIKSTNNYTTKKLVVR